MTWCNAAIRLVCLAALGVVAGTVVGTVVGCGDTQRESGGKSAQGKQSITIVNKVDPATVAPSKLSTTQPVPLEKGKLVVFAPLGWQLGPRPKQGKGLVQFRRSRTETHTSIKVYAEDYSALNEVTTENQAQFVEQIQQALDRELLDHPKVLVQKAAPITLKGITVEGHAAEGDATEKNDFIGAHYVRRGTAKTSDGKSLKLDRLFLVTVVGGRKYSVELQTLADFVHATRADAHAVAAGMKFYDTAKTGGTGGTEDKATVGDDAKP